MPELVLLPFEPRYQHAGHYLLFSKRSGRGRDYARAVAAGTLAPPHALVEAALYDGCELSIARVWPGAGRPERRRLRRQGSLARICPMCAELAE